MAQFVSNQQKSFMVLGGADVLVRFVPGERASTPANCFEWQMHNDLFLDAYIG